MRLLLGLPVLFITVLPVILFAVLVLCVKRMDWNPLGLFTEYQIFYPLSWLDLKRSLAQIDEIVQILSLLVLQSQWSNNQSPGPLLINEVVRALRYAKFFPFFFCYFFFLHYAGLQCIGDHLPVDTSNVHPARPFCTSAFYCPLLWLSTPPLHS